jgi:hypothetical protein
MGSLNRRFIKPAAEVERCARQSVSFQIGCSLGGSKCDDWEDIPTSKAEQHISISCLTEPQLASLPQWSRRDDLVINIHAPMHILRQRRPKARVHLAQEDLHLHQRQTARFARSSVTQTKSQYMRRDA